MKDKLKRILAINDLSGWGHTSLMAVIPIMYRLGIQVAALPTAVLSANTDYPDFVLSDQTGQMRDTLRHWETLGLRFEAVYSGFLGSPRQAELLLPYLEKLLAPGGMILIDPVMGDVGGLYSCYDGTIVTAMTQLISHAGVITPNLFEASALLHEDFDANITQAGIREYCLKLQLMGARNVVITSIPPRAKDLCAVAVLTETKVFEILEAECLDTWYPGTGDVFASFLLAAMLRGNDLSASALFAMRAISEGIRLSLESPQDHRDGLHLEILLNSTAFTNLLRELPRNEP